MQRRKKKLWLSLPGRDGVKIYETFPFADANDAKKTVPVLDHFTDYFEPLKSEVFDRFCFHKRHEIRVSFLTRGLWIYVAWSITVRTR
jgi:hypothetical protein